MSAPLPFAQRYRTIVAAIATIACCDIAMGLTLQLLPLIMEQNRVPAWIMGRHGAFGHYARWSSHAADRIVSRVQARRPCQHRHDHGDARLFQAFSEHLG